MAADDTNQNGMNLLWLENASFWANVAVVVFGVLAAIAAVFALYFSLKRDAAKDADLARFQQASRVSIANADARGAEANEKAAAAGEGTAKALAEVANANARTRLLEVEAASQKEQAAMAEKDLLALRQTTAPRRLTAEQKGKLTSLLQPFSTLPITLEWVGAGTDDIPDLASDIFDAIRNAGITIPNKNIDWPLRSASNSAARSRRQKPSYRDRIKALTFRAVHFQPPILIEPLPDSGLL